MMPPNGQLNLFVFPLSSLENEDKWFNFVGGKACKQLYWKRKNGIYSFKLMQIGQTIDSEILFS